MDVCRVPADAEHFSAEVCEVSVIRGHLFEFLRADEGEVCGVKNEDHPFAAVICGVDLCDVAFVVGVGMEIGDFIVDL